jgi:hypothetical protein
MEALRSTTCNQALHQDLTALPFAAPPADAPPPLPPMPGAPLKPDAPLRDVRISPNEELHTKASALTLWRGHSRYSSSHPSSFQRERDFQSDFNRWWNKCSSLTDAECAAIRDGTLVAVAGFRLMPLSSFLKVHIKTNAVVSP